jgi:alcohol dehydrogenase
MAAHDYPALLAEVDRGRLRPDLLVTRRITLDEAPGALVEMDGHVGPGVTVVLPYARGETG